MNSAFGLTHATADRPARHTDEQSQCGPFRLLPNLRTEAASRRRLQRDLHHALQTESLEIHFQPRLCLQTGQFRTAEAMLLWPHRKLGLLTAPHFLPVAEQTGQILQIGAWYLRTAADMVVACQTALPHNWMVSVRLSERQLCDEILLSQLAETLEATGLSPGRLEIELGEALLPAIDIDMLLTLSAIRDLGIGLTLDEFGTGFASLSALKRLPLTAIKLHRSLIRHLPRDREDAAVVRALIEAGHALGFDIIADGIETESQRAFLSASGCDTGQGALFSPLLPPTQFRDWITRP